MGTAAKSRISRPRVTVRDLVRDIAAQLAAASVADPAREARHLVAALTDQGGWSSLAADRVVDEAMYAEATAAANLRARGMPLAYCVGTAAFRHLVLEVDGRVLIPRPETEQLVDVALRAAGSRAGGLAIDVGTGSGAVALALASEGCFDLVIGTDVSLDAIAVARRNVARLTGHTRSAVEIRPGSLLSPCIGLTARLIVSNPPYIALSEAASLPKSVRDWEPPVALFSGDGGLGITARLVREAGGLLEPGGYLAIEVDSRRARRVGAMVAADTRYEAVTVLPDLTRRERFVVARRKEDA